MLLKNNKLGAWLNSQGHFQGIFWTVCACFFSNLGDITIRTLGSDLPAMQITFFRLFFGVLVLLPILVYKGKSAFYIKNKKHQFARIFVGFSAIACWVYGASQTSLPSITTISFVCPLLVLPLAYFFLGEKSDWRRLLAVGLAFLGVVIIAFFEGLEGGQLISDKLLLHKGVLFLFLGAGLFALSDILNKKMVASENIYSLVFYFNLGAALISLVPALLVFKPLDLRAITYLFMAGISGVLLLYCILKATAATDISSIAPYKYFELILSIIMGYLLFNEIIKVSTVIGAGLIVPSALLIGYHEIKKERKAKRMASG
jgi:S-adenosylmethionine uptake transporter